MSRPGVQRKCVRPVFDGAPRLEKRVVLLRLQDAGGSAGYTLVFDPLLEGFKKNAIRVPKKCGIHTINV